MMGYLDSQTGMAHLAFDCPVCDRPVHMVADPARRQARWCCLNCQIMGTGKVAVAQNGPALELPVPAASA
jgi:hypothetical protein